MIKMHGTENTFYIVTDSLTDEAMRNLSINLCQDGTDGVLFECDSKHALSKMRIFNADGSEPEMCGNGLRCFSRFILEKNNKREAYIETMNETYYVQLIDDFHGIKGVTISLYPVKALSRAEEATFKTVYDFSYYTVSNPHLVAFTPSHLDADELTELGVYGNKHFDKGININMVRIIDQDKIYVQTYERGVGITKSCGTGMTSSTLHYALKHQRLDQTIQVYNDGGMIECRVTKKDHYEVMFTGNATYVSEHDDQGHFIKTYDEANAYDVFFKKTRDGI